MVHQKTKGISIFAAAKTMEKLFGGADREAWRFFTMKRAQAHEIGAPFFKLNIAADNLHDINAGQQFLDK